MKYPQRGQTILQCRDSSRDEQTGQNWTARSVPAGPRSDSVPRLGPSAGLEGRATGCYPRPHVSRKPPIAS